MLKEISKPPKNPNELRVWLQKILREHQKAINMLITTTTDYDRFEKLQRGDE